MSNVSSVPHSFSSPIPTRASKAAVSTFAEQLAHHLDFKPGDLIKSLITRIGGRIEYKNPDLSNLERLPESIIVYAQSNFVIFVPNMTSPERDRFTIAHELGHYYLHYPLASRAKPHVPMVATRWVDDTNPDQQRAEWEANWFAAAFLMPSMQYKAIFESSRKDLQTIASYFGVSQKAAEVRASVLGLQ